MLKYKVEIEGYASEIYECDIKEILFIISTFADIDEITSINKI